jgi:beta-aspartyl-peptidase (threonine type)
MSATEPIGFAGMRMLLVHGGVSGVARPERPELTHAHAAAATARFAPDVVELAVRALEDDERLNAGYGSVLNRSGYLELDAGIADGRRGKSGAVANVVVRHPISLARRVLEHTPHVLMTGGGAAELGADMELLTDTSPAQRERWLEAHSQGRLGTEDFGGP